MRIQLHTKEGVKEIEISEEEALKKGYIDERSYYLEKIIKLCKNKKLIEKLERI